MEAMEAMNLDDESYIGRLQDVRKETEALRKEEDGLLDRLIKERLFLAQFSKIDQLTGLYTRKILPKVREIGTIIMCDIDDFKQFNDTYGHAAGDEVLQAVSTAIQENIRIGDIGCRFGGDEFLIIFTTDNKEVIDARMRKIAAEARSAVEFPGINLTLSIGIAFNEGEKLIAMSPDKNHILEQLIEHADLAMYDSKGSGKNRISYYDPTKEYKNKRPEKIKI